MPRIPEGKFRTEPSTRVESAKPLVIQSQGDKLRKISQEAGQVAGAIEKAEQRVESMKFAKDSAQEWEQKELPVINNLFSVSQSGYIKKGTKLADGSVIEKDTKLEEVVKKRVNAFNQRALASTTNPEAQEMFSKYVFSDTENKISEAAVHAKEQITNDTINGLKSNGSLLMERLIDGDASANELNKYYSSVLDSAPMIGNDDVNNVIKGFQQSLGSRAHEIVLNHKQGLDQTKIDEAKALTKFLPEDLRRNALRKIENAVTRRKEIEFNRKVETNSKLATINTPFERAAKTKQLEQATRNNLNAPLAEFETPQSRISSNAAIMGKTAAIDIMATAGQFKPNSVEFKAAFAERVNQSFRDIASSNMDQFVDVEQAKAAVLAEAQTQVTALIKRRDKDPRQFQKDFFPSAEIQLAKNNPEGAIPQIIEQQMTWGKTADETMLAASSDTKSDKKLFQAMRDGEDPSGIEYLKLIDDNNQRFGKYSYKMYKDSAAMDGYDSSSLYISQIADQKTRQGIAAGHGNFDANLAYMVDKGIYTSKSDERLTPKTLEKKFMNDVKDYVNKELSPDALYFGANNHVRYEGYTKSVAYLAAQYVRGGKDVSNSLQLAHKTMQDEFPMVSDGYNMLSIPKSYAQANNIDTEEMGTMLKDAKSMKHIADMGIKIDFEKFKDITKNNAKWAGKFEGIAGKSYSPKEQIEEFVSQMEDNIVVTSDPNDPTKIKFYLRDPKTNFTTPIPILEDGKRKQLTVPFVNYYNQGAMSGRSTDFGGTYEGGFLE